MPGRHNALSRVPDVLTEDGIGGIEVPPGKKMLEIFDACGLYLLVEPKAKGWRFRWQRDGKERLMSLDPWPKIGLAEARQKGQALRDELGKGQQGPSLVPLALPPRVTRGHNWERSTNSQGSPMARRARRPKAQPEEQRNIGGRSSAHVGKVGLDAQLSLQRHYHFIDRRNINRGN
jgi:hypothetical protein